MKIEIFKKEIDQNDAWIIVRKDKDGNLQPVVATIETKIVSTIVICDVVVLMKCLIIQFSKATSKVTLTYLLKSITISISISIS